MKTLVIVSHPTIEQSTVIRTLQSEAEKTTDVTVRNLEKLYGNNTNAFDIEAEQSAHEGIDRIVYLYPIHWFNLTPMLKAYLNQVWTYGWAFGENAQALKNKTMQVVVSAGSTASTYSAEGLIQSTIDEVLTPMKACALYVGMKYAQPCTFYESMGVSAERLTHLTKQFAQILISPPPN
jgi:glutathione-regulated potassium-efflux system ancillary protein KefF